MNYKKIIIISILLLVLSVTAVSATDFNDDYVIESSDNVDSFFESSELQDSNDLSASTGTFDDLQLLVNNASENSVLELTMDYKGSKNSRIQLNKDLTINGNGHTIDCLDKEGCIAFYSNSGTITLKNLNIINGHNGNIHRGGAIYITGTARYTIENCTFEDNWADDYGGAICNDASNTLTIRDCTFKSNKVDDACGGAITSNGVLNIENSKFVSNSAPEYGGAIYTYDKLNIFNCIFESNKVSNSDGGAVYSTGNVKIVNSTFKKNFAEWSGGALSAWKDARIDGCLFESNKVDGVIVQDASGGAIRCSGTVYINNSTFKDNYADDYAGAIDGKDIYINYDQNSNQSFNTFFINNKADDSNAGAIRAWGNLYMKNAVFTSNKAYVDGGAIYADNDVTMSNCLFESNKADGAVSQCYGGAIRANGDVFLENSTFKDNYAHDYGGAIYADCVSINVNQAYPQAFNSFFINNKASDNKGGAIYAEDDVKALNAVFSGNKADVDGGAIYSEDDVTVKHCLFESNKADGAAVSQCYGGAIRADDVSVENSTFKDNYAEDYGGAIYADSVSINVNQDRNQAFNSFFINNKAGDNKGGAIYADDGNVKALNTVFSGNKAYVDGGAIYSDDNVYVTHCLFENNRAEGAAILSCYGGAFRSQDDAVVDNCTFRNNYAENEGGAIHADHLRLNNTCIFEGNTARDDGGAIWVNYILNDDVKYSKFIGNKAKKEDGGAIYIDNMCSVNFVSCVFVNNTCGDEGGAIYTDDFQSEVGLKYNIFIGNDAGDTGDSVYCGGNYGQILNNYWGGKNPSKNNGQLIEWMPLVVPNKHHSDSDPLTMVLVTDGSAIIGQTVTATQKFYKSDGGSFLAPILNDDVVFDVSNAKIIDKRYNGFSVSVDFIPQDVKLCSVSANLYGKSVSKTLQISTVKITAPDIIGYYSGYQTLKIHLDGDSISKQRVVVSLNSKNYVEYTDENGDASIFIDSLPSSLGRHDIAINVYGINTTAAVTVLSTIYGNDLTIDNGEYIPFEVRFLDNTGKNLTTGRLISYQIDAERIKHTFIQNDDGIMSFDISSLTPGVHNFTVINQLTKENKTFEIIILPQLINLNNGGSYIQHNASEDIQQDNLLSPDSQQDKFLSRYYNPSTHELDVAFVAIDNQLFDVADSSDNNQSDDLGVKNKSGNSVDKSISNESKNDFNIYWILLLILLIVAIAAGSLIWKYKK